MSYYQSNISNLKNAIDKVDVNDYKNNVINSTKAIPDATKQFLKDNVPRYCDNVWIDLKAVNKKIDESISDLNSALKQLKNQEINSLPDLRKSIKNRKNDLLEIKKCINSLIGKVYNFKVTIE